jgi:hypothetical protein
MTMIRTIEPQNWDAFLNEFTERNRGRRARYEVFSGGDIIEEDEEAHLESISINDGSVTVKRTYEMHGEPAETKVDLENIRGISVQYDTDNSEDMLEFTNERNELVTLRLESRVDGVS